MIFLLFMLQGDALAVTIYLLDVNILLPQSLAEPTIDFTLVQSQWEIETKQNMSTR